MSNLDSLFDKNRAWVKAMTEEDLDFFKETSKDQSPDYLWIGCSDSRVPANQIVDLPPGDVFVHRNIANIVVHTDMNCLSVIQFAVEVLEVKHIIICGHYGCGGIKASMQKLDQRMVGNWLRHVRDVTRFHAAELSPLSDNDKLDRLCELNVQEQVINVCNTASVQRAWGKNQDLSVHGWIYDMESGLLNDMNVSASSNSDFVDNYIKVSKV